MGGIHGKNNLFRFTIQQCRSLFPATMNDLRSPHSQRVSSSAHTATFSHGTEHGSRNLRRFQIRCCPMIQIDHPFSSLHSPSPYRYNFSYSPGCSMSEILWNRSSGIAMQYPHPLFRKCSGVLTGMVPIPCFLNLDAPFIAAVIDRKV